jgi:phosphate transport system protein
MSLAELTFNSPQNVTIEPMPRIQFHQRLGDLKDRLLSQAALAQQALDCVLDAYAGNDLGLCQHVMDNEQAINSFERLIDQAAYDLLAMEQPMAVDLRFLLAVIKINSDLERVGDQCVNIADRVRASHGLNKVELPVDIAKMGEIAGTMVRTSIQALLEADAEIAETVLEMDDLVDDMDRRASHDLMELMMREPACAEQALDAIIICRNLERIGDHATNIAEDVIFWLRGADVRHRTSLAEA